MGYRRGEKKKNSSLSREEIYNVHVEKYSFSHTRAETNRMDINVNLSM